MILIFSIFNLKKKKKKKTPGDVIILQLCTKNLDDMTYSSWDTERDILKLVILGHFLAFYSPENQKKIKILKKWNKLLEISSFNSCIYRKQQLYDVQFLRYRVRQAEVCIHTERTKSNSLNYAYFTDMVICFEYWDIFTRNFMHLLACLF